MMEAWLTSDPTRRALRARLAAVGCRLEQPSNQLFVGEGVVDEHFLATPSCAEPSTASGLVPSMPGARCDGRHPRTKWKVH